MNAHSKRLWWRVLAAVCVCILVTLVVTCSRRPTPGTGDTVGNQPMRNPFADALLNAQNSPDPIDGKAALLRMLKEGVPASKWPFPQGDLSRLNGQLQEGRSGMEKCPATYRSGPDYSIEGWVCELGVPSFRRSILLSSGTRYKIRGHFSRTPGGEWRAEVSGVARLVTRSEARAGTQPSNSPNETIEIVPTFEEAMKALIEWIQSKDPLSALVGSGPRHDVAAALNLTAVRGGLIGGVAKKGHRGYEIDGWSIFTDDSEFQTVVPLSPITSRGPMLLIGRLRLAESGEWNVESVSLWPLMK